MPHSLVINFIPVTPIYPEFQTGRHLHALFLTLASSVDQELGNYLHAQDKDKAFTLSPIQIVGNRGRHLLQWQHKEAIAANTPCWWRISLLDDKLFGKLAKLWLNLNPSQPWHLGPADLQITSVLGTPQSTQPWANFTTYRQIYEEASESDRTLSFNFYTPTAFRQGKYDSPLPTRESVFLSLLSRWNQYSPIEFTTDILQQVFPSRFNLHTEVVSNYKSNFIGCVGEITFRLMGDIDPIAIKQINALANFALYSGIGRKTTMGMGMVRRA